jgi:hypothetical protein
MKSPAALAFLTLLCAAALSRGQESAASKPASRPVPVTPAEKVAAIEAEYEDAMKAFDKLYEQAKTPEERQALFTDKYPKASNWFPRLLEIAKANPKDAAAFKALKWIVTQDSDADAGSESLAILGRDYVSDPGLAEVADELAYSNRSAAEKFLRVAMQQSPHEEVKGRAAYNLAQVLKRFADVARRLADSSDEEEQKRVAEFCGEAMCSYLRSLDGAKALREAEDLLVMVGEKYGSVAARGGKRKLAELVEGDLFEMRKLAIGMVAPEIEGEDVFAKPIKLSDFRGKVVVLDFWGHW